MADLRWEEPPSRPIRGTDYRVTVDALRARSGEWAIVYETDGNRGRADNLATNIRQARLAAFRPAGAFEAVSRAGKVYARYVGEPS